MSQIKRRIDVMISSTTRDLGEYRRRIAEIVSRFKFVPRLMDLDSTTGKDGITYSLDLVDEAEVYILLLGSRYGHIPDDPRNPEQISITQMEYERALEREARGELCVLPFVLEEDVLLSPENSETDPTSQAKLEAFRDLVLKKQVVFFDNMESLEQAVMLSLANSPCVQRFREQGGDERPFAPRVGEVLENYRFEKILGKGGNGEIWKVQERLPDGKSAPAAIKLLRREISENPQRVERFKKEISVARRLKHPYILRTTYWGEIAGQFYAVMDYIEGQTLRDMMTGRSFSHAETIRLLGQVAEALGSAHKDGFVHRDVKPENILVNDHSVFLSDFGLAISPDNDESVTKSGELVGTKKYMAPEQWDNQTVTPQTDIYALGFIAYEMLTGVYPYDVSSHYRLSIQHMNDPLPKDSRLPDEILRILRRATAKDPEERYSSANEFISELKHWKLDKANLETKIVKYLDMLYANIKGEFYEQFFVDLSGEVRRVMPEPQPVEQENKYPDPYVDDIFSDFMVGLAADRHQPQMEPKYVPNILEQLQDSERVVLVGEPGAGKSFTLRRLVIQYIRDYEEGGRIPVFVPLNAYTGENTFKEYIQQQMGETGSYYTRLRAQGRLVFICDALNEMPRKGVNGRNLIEAVRKILRNAYYYVVSCRIRDYHNELDRLNVEWLEVREMELPAIYEFIKKYLPDDWQAFWERIGGSRALVEFWKAVNEKGEPERFWQEDNRDVPGYTSSDADNAWYTMWQGAKLIPLARNPYLARVICTLHRRQQMPTNRAELYDAFVSDLYERERKNASIRGYDFPSREKLEGFLTTLATDMQAEKTTVIKRQSIKRNGENLQAALDANILAQQGEDLRFTHQLLQEYFAAKTLVQRMYADEMPLELLRTAWWNMESRRETSIMIAEFTREPERTARWIGQINPWLAIETLQHIYQDQFLEDLDSITTNSLIDSAHAKRNEKHAVGRALAYRVLGFFNADHRPGIGVDPQTGLPDVDWIPIPYAGNWTYQDTDGPHLPLFEIGIHPITYAQFQTFLDDPEGFANQRWWQGLAATEEHCRAPRDQAFPYWNHPRERVSWYDAMAFCRWWSWKLTGNIFALEDIERWPVRLPTEYEWEKAARGDTGWQYPYGNELDATKGNTSETDINMTSAVGIFPKGASPYGVLDMSGNVWEWCLTDYKHPAEFAGDEDITTDAWRVLRGGAWQEKELGAARTVVRTHSYPYRRFSFNGFRVVRILK